MLAADADATVGNERAHNPGQRISCKLRGGLKPRTIEQLTLACLHLQKQALAKVKSYASVPDATEAFEFEEMQEAWASAGAGGAAGAGGSAAAGAGAAADEPDDDAADIVLDNVDDDDDDDDDDE